MILLEEPAAAFNVHRAGLDVPPAHVCRLPPQSPGTRRGGVRRVYRSGEIYKLAVKPCLTRCKGRGSPPDKRGYKKTHPFGPESPALAVDAADHILHADWRAVSTCSLLSAAQRQHPQTCTRRAGWCYSSQSLGPDLLRWSLIGDWIEFFQTERSN